MGHHLLEGNPPIEVILRKSARARRISLRMSQLDGRVTLTMPNHIAQPEALAFLHEQEDWLRQHLSNRKQDVALCFGASLPIQGQLRVISPTSEKRIHLSDTEIFVPGGQAQLAARLAAFCKQTARTALASASDHYAETLGRSYSKLTLRDTRSRWGSCTSAGALMYSWRLILCPPEVLRYVAAHEVAHLEQMNHSPAFWATVERIHGPYQEPRAWLRKNGADLHRYQF